MEVTVGPEMCEAPLRPERGSPKVIAMVHVPSNNSLQNTPYAATLGAQTYSCTDVETLNSVRRQFLDLVNKCREDSGIVWLDLCRSAPLVMLPVVASKVVSALAGLQFVESLVERALSEVEIFVRQGINIIEVENVGAPYFLGNEVPIEDLLILHIVCSAIRSKFPTIYMGMHVLSGNEIESLPIAIVSGAFFVRSESTLFGGHRPEGRVQNRGNLAKFFYLRNYLHAVRHVEDPKHRHWPQVWSDLQKKHTVFDQELGDLGIWLDTVLFCKVEGVIITGQATGSDVIEEDLRRAREAIDAAETGAAKLSGGSFTPFIPLITGSGWNVEMYRKYADYLITGTQLKERKYWENAVSEENVAALVKSLAKKSLNF